MPVRIYDIAKKLGLESKKVLAKAKELGITAARVPSSSLDKITAEYLEGHFKPATPPPISTPTPSEPMPATAEAPPAQPFTPAAPSEGPHIETRGEAPPAPAPAFEFTPPPSAPEPEAPEPVETRG